MSEDDSEEIWDIPPFFLPIAIVVVESRPEGGYLVTIPTSVAEDLNIQGGEVLEVSIDFFNKSLLFKLPEDHVTNFDIDRKRLLNFPIEYPKRLLDDDKRYLETLNESARQ